MEFRVLGPVEVVGELGAINLGGPQQRRVAAAMSADPGHVLTYDRLQEVLWPAGEEPPNARRTAISYVSRLRAALGDGIVTTTDAGYVLDLRTCTVDAERFTALSEQARMLPGAVPSTCSTKRWHCGEVRCSATSPTSGGRYRW